jgi:hypothetical protein
MVSKNGNQLSFKMNPRNFLTTTAKNIREMISQHEIECCTQHSGPTTILCTGYK